jgi:integrase
MATIRRRGSKWHVQIRRKGSQSLTRSFHHLKDAQAWARQMELQADRRDLPADRKVLDDITLGDLVTRYRDTVTPRKPTAANETIVLNSFLSHPICRRTLAELTTAHFAEYRDERLKEIKPSSLKRALVPISHMFTVAQHDWGLPLRDNPLSKLTINNIDVRRERRLRPGELDRLKEAAGKSRNNIILPVFLFALATAMRRGEILSAHWEHIDWQGRSLLIPLTKTGQPRTIPLTRTALEVLQSLPRKRDHIFPVSPNAFRLAWQRVLHRAKINDLHFHDLRHEAISAFFEMGLSAPEVALISGHRDLRMLFRYSHPLRANVLEKFDARERLSNASGTSAAP